jgi:hypothetical protein
MQYEVGYEYLDDKNYMGVNGKGTPATHMERPQPSSSLVHQR